MNSVVAGSAYYPEKRALALPIGQLILLFLLLGVSGPLILITIAQGAYPAVLLVGVVSVGGLLLCRKMQLRLGDPSLKVLGYFWLIKLAATLFLLYAGWIPQLDPASSSAWGYDPQRYYVQAQELIENNWLPDFVSLNYVGILYYYGAIFYVLGHNPVVPALVNAFVTLVATLYLVEVGYEIKSRREPHDWTLALALLLPEMLWFDVMTSRETLLAALLVVATLTAGRYLARTAPSSLSKVLFTSGLSVLVIAAVRTSMLLPVFAAIALMTVLVTPQQSSRVAQRAILAAAAVAVLIFGPLIAPYLGGYEFDVERTIEVAISARENALISDVNWSENSIGALLLPEGLIQSILFLPPRMVLYLLAPLPNIAVPLSELVAGSWDAWQRLFALMSSVINVLAVPYALASLVQSIKNRRVNGAPLVLHVSYWIVLMAVAGGNLIIHERYRVMATPFLWGCAWLGARTCSRAEILRASLPWYSLLGLGALFYLAYKGL